MKTKRNYDRHAEDGNLNAFRAVPLVVEENLKRGMTKEIAEYDWKSLKTYLVPLFPKVMAILPTSKAEAQAMGMKCYKYGKDCKRKHGHGVRYVEDPVNRTGKCVTCLKEDNDRKAEKVRALRRVHDARTTALRKRAREVAKLKGWDRPVGFREITSGKLKVKDLAPTREEASELGHIIYAKLCKDGSVRPADFGRQTQADKKRNEHSQLYKVNRENALESRRRRSRKFNQSERGKALYRKHATRRKVLKNVSPVSSPVMPEAPEQWICPLSGFVSDFIPEDHKGKPIMEWDHIVPLSTGGWHHEANLAPTHGSANSRKGGRLYIIPIEYNPEVKRFGAGKPVFYKCTLSSLKQLQKDYGPKGRSPTNNLKRLERLVFTPWISENERRKALSIAVAEAPKEQRKAFLERCERLHEEANGAEIALEVLEREWLIVQSENVVPIDEK